MTTIATDGRTIAADGLRVIGSERICLDEKKIRVRHGRIFAFTGDYAAFEPAIEWYVQKCHHAGEEPKGDWSLIVIETDGTLSKYSSKLPYPEPMPYPATFGADCDYAMAAMHCGKTPREAIELAIKLGVWTGGEIQVVDIAEALAQQPLAEISVVDISDSRDATVKPLHTSPPPDRFVVGR